MRCLDIVTIKSFKITRLQFFVLTKLELSSKHTRCDIAYKVDTGCDGTLLNVNNLENCSQVPPRNSKNVK